MFFDYTRTAPRRAPAAEDNGVLRAGPTRTKSYYEDDLVVCVLRGGFSRVEQTLLEAAAPRPSFSSDWSSRS